LKIVDTHIPFFFCLTLTLCVLFQTKVVADPSSVPSSELGLSKTKPQEGLSVEVEQGYMIAYTGQLPGTDVTFEMIPIPGGEFLLGSPDGEVDRNKDEGPQVRVNVPPFWMAKCEVTWAEYHAYMSMYDAFKKINELRVDAEAAKEHAAVKTYLEQESLEVDAVTAPTPLYDPDAAYAAGEEPDQPAVTMTQYAAKQYTKWLSGITGNVYRLPSEAEWEYAARAGSTTAYSFGDDAEELPEHGWFDENADYETHPVGSKPANAWGLHDMHGNAAEWVLDGYLADHYSTLGKAATNSTDAVAWPTKLYPRVIRGGSWLDEAAACRSATRHQSDDSEWALSDPNLPVSPWWFTEDLSTGVGFRIMRPLNPPDKEMREKVWDPDVKYLKLDVADRLNEGRGTESSADKRLPAAIKQLHEAGLLD